MNPFQQLFSNSKTREQTQETEADKVIIYIKSLINREDLVDELIKKYYAAQKITGDQRELSYISIYIGLEAFIVKNRPLIVKQEFTKGQLRETIKQQFNLNALSPVFRLLFLPDLQQNMLLFEQGAQKLASYVVSNIGPPRLSGIIASLKQEKVKGLIKIDAHGLQFDSVESSVQGASDNEIKLAFQELFEALFLEIKKSVGPNVAEKVITDIFEEVRRTYDYDIIAKFMDILPGGVLENERIRLLGREELEKKIRSRTNELDEARKQLEQKLDLIKKQNDELTQAKQALLVSLTEEKRLEEEIKKEKEQVEEKVKERTGELEQKTQELNNAMTSLKVSYQQTENERARLLASINNLSLGFVMTDSSDGIIAINNISYQILKCQPDKSFKTIQQLDEYLHTSVDINVYYQKAKSEKLTQKTADIAFENTFLRLFFTPIMMNTTCIGVVIIIEDISEAKLLERSKDEFFAVASHELRTPLTAIRGFTSLILDNFQDQLKENKTMTDMVVNIHQSSIRLIKIVNNFLDASKLEQGKFSFNLQAFALIPVIESVVTDLGLLADQKHIYLKFDNSVGQIPDVYADSEKLKQIIINLVGNAIKFTEKGGVTISLKKEQDYIKVFVKDTGLGVSEEYRQLLFRKFQQAGERILTRDAATGSGMGLYISKLLVEAMKGTISIEDTELSEGSTFSFTIPIAEK